MKITTPPLKELLARYDVPVPRYTSYPTVPFWTTNPTEDEWIGHLNKTFENPDSSWSVYIHIPYCETLCTFCGCNNIITKDHQRESGYVDLVLKEWAIYLEKVGALRTKPLKHIHLGGGSPTFLSADNLVRLLKPILDSVQKVENFEASIEVDPRRTTKDHLVALRALGFNRISLGVQDFNETVQRLVNRIQPFEITEQINSWARELGYTSVNFDLIYGLAKQTKETMVESTLKTISLKPDRIALYSFALVPWIKPAQRLFKDEDLPKAQEKRELYEIARELLLKNGYVEVGMDHFALLTDSLAHAQTKKALHRNFMGYTDQRTDVMLGLGVSSISETPYSFHQNEKVLPLYESKLNQFQIPLTRGHVLTDEDMQRRQQILKLMTRYSVDLEPTQVEPAHEFLKPMIEDGLVEIHKNQLSVLEPGRPFLRNVCAFFDERLKRQQPQTRIFSQSI